MFDLLSILENSVGGSSCRTVRCYCWKHCLVHLLPGHNDYENDDDNNDYNDDNDDDNNENDDGMMVLLIIAGQEEDHILTDDLQWIVGS